MKLSGGETNRAGTAAYAKGQAMVRTIIETAWRIAIDEGMAGLSMRRIAREMGISPGNLSYYYASKADLLEDLLTCVIDGYLKEFERLREQPDASPEAQLRAVICFVLDDIATRETTLFFPDLWALANRDEWAAKHMERVYAGYRAVLEEIIADFCVCPDPEVHRRLALVISGSIEGQTVFIGHDRPHHSRFEHIKALVIEQSIALVRAMDAQGNICGERNAPQPIRSTSTPNNRGRAL